MGKKWFAQIVPMITEIYNEKVPIKDVSPFPIDKEAKIPTSNGKKTHRRPYILVKRPDGSLYGINVGKTTAKGTSIKREVEVLYDLEDAGIPMWFISYDDK